MSQLSDYAEVAVASWILGKATPAAVGTRYLALFTSTVDDAGTGIEVTGGAYTRQDCTTPFPTPSGTSGQTDSNADITYSAATGNWGTITDYAIMDSNVIKSFTNASINTGTDGITITSHGISNGTQARVSKTIGDTFPSGITEGTAYYVRSVDANTVSLHPTAADATGNTNKIDITAAGTGTFYLGCGNFLMQGKLKDNALSADESETVNNGSTFKVPSGKLRVTLA
jgi:hypothetical protein